MSEAGENESGFGLPRLLQDLVKVGTRGRNRAFHGNPRGLVTSPSAWGFTPISWEQGFPDLLVRVLRRASPAPDSPGSPHYHASRGKHTSILGVQNAPSAWSSDRIHGMICPRIAPRKNCVFRTGRYWCSSQPNFRSIHVFDDRVPLPWETGPLFNAAVAGFGEPAGPVDRQRRRTASREATFTQTRSAKPLCEPHLKGRPPRNRYPAHLSTIPRCAPRTRIKGNTVHSANNASTAPP